MSPVPLGSDVPTSEQLRVLNSATSSAAEKQAATEAANVSWAQADPERARQAEAYAAEERQRVENLRLEIKAQEAAQKARDVVQKGESLIGTAQSAVKEAAGDWTPIQRLVKQIPQPALPNNRVGEFMRDVVGKTAGEFVQVVGDIGWDMTGGLIGRTVKSAVMGGKALPLSEVLPGASAFAKINPAYAKAYSAADKTQWGSNLSDAYLTAQQLATAGAVGKLLTTPLQHVVKEVPLKGFSGITHLARVGVPGTSVLAKTSKAVGKFVPWAVGAWGATELRQAVEMADKGPDVILPPVSPAPVVNITNTTTTEPPRTTEKGETSTPGVKEAGEGAGEAASAAASGITSSDLLKAFQLGAAQGVGKGIGSQIFTTQVLPAGKEQYGGGIGSPLTAKKKKKKRTKAGKRGVSKRPISRRGAKSSQKEKRKHGAEGSVEPAGETAVGEAI